MLKLNFKRPPYNYESVIIMHPDTTEEDQKKFFQQKVELVKQFEGKVNHVDTWGKRKLANPIDDIALGIYFHSTFIANNKCVAELGRVMRINDKILRFSHLRLDDRVGVSKHLESYREVIAGSVERDKEREARIQSKRAARSNFSSRA